MHLDTDKWSLFRTAGGVVRFVVGVAWALVIVALVAHFAATCFYLICGTLFQERLGEKHWLILVATWVFSAFAYGMLGPKWPAPYDALRQVLRFLVAIPLAIEALSIVGGLVIYGLSLLQ